MPSTPYMKLYIGDYLGDTQHLSCLEHGAYMLLIMAYWQAGGPITSDPVVLRRITKTDKKEYKNWHENVLKMFEERDSMLVHKRIDLEIAKRAQVSEASTNAAKARWSERNADAMPTHSGRNATPIVHSPESIDKREKDNTNIPQTFDDFWTAYPRKTDKQGAIKKYRALLKSGIGHDVIMARLKVYESQLDASHTQVQYIKYPSRFLNTLDDYEHPEPVKPTAPPEREIETVTVPPEIMAAILRSQQPVSKTGGDSESDER